MGVANPQELKDGLRLPVICRTRKPPAYVDACDSTTGWVASANCTLGTDATYYNAGAALTSLSLTGKGDQGLNTLNAHKAFSSLDATGKHLLMRYYIKAGSGSADPTNITTIQLNLKGDAAWTGNFTIMSGAAPGGGAGPRFLRLPLDAVTWGAADKAQFKDLSLVVNTTNNTDTVTVLVDWIAIVPKLTTALYVAGFDDAPDAGGIADKFAAVMAERGIPVTIYCEGAYFTGANSARLSQMQRWQQAGHLILGHGYDPTTWDSQTALTTRQAGLRRMQAIFEGVGMAGAGYGHATPGGYSWADDLTHIIGNQLAQMRVTYSTGLGQAPWMMQMPTADAGSTAQAEALLTSMIAAGGVASCLWHPGDLPDAAAWTALETHADNVLTAWAAGDVKPVTMLELLDAHD